MKKKRPSYVLYGRQIRRGKKRNGESERKKLSTPRPTRAGYNDIRQVRETTLKES